MKLDNNNHSVFLLNYHLVLVIRYGREVIDETISERLKEIFYNICSKYNISLEKWSNYNNHIHILFRAHPNSQLSKFLNAYKSASSRLIKKEFPEIKEKLWKECFWSKSFCLITTGEDPIEEIKEYIENEGKR